MLPINLMMHAQINRIGKKAFQCKTQLSALFVSVMHKGTLAHTTICFRHRLSLHKYNQTCVFFFYYELKNALI